ncbi:lysophospholipid acyltransferase family protein [Desmospora activa]|uniref:Acyltransferase-like protein n=1 Tax=Desmospora activa DSM 45169 TaxID=1121389 RepID=A0A2T4Z816_9BACL|nr:lysophospholipid acyltransferase family protein [Desmospora activa]PTM58041.1 acyltransferase-like protein [Desmospora activa DSM 45169]
MTQPAIQSFDQRFARYSRKYLLQRHFHFIGQMGTVYSHSGRSTLYIMNHSSWWDGLVAYFAIQQEDSGVHYLMINHEQMSNLLPPQEKDSSQTLSTTLQSAIQLLHQGERVWLFPQGEIQHLDQRPLSFQTDVGHLLQKCPHTQVKPVTVQYLMGTKMKPEATLWFGEPFSLDWSTLSLEEITRYLQVRLEKQLDDHKARLLSHPVGSCSDFVPLLKNEGSRKKWFRFPF